MQHKIENYRDGFQSVEFCSICGKEGSELAEKCDPLNYKCAQCGHLRAKEGSCINCENIRLKFKKAVDKSNLRN